MLYFVCSIVLMRIDMDFITLLFKHTFYMGKGQGQLTGVSTETFTHIIIGVHYDT